MKNLVFFILVSAGLFADGISSEIDIHLPRSFDSLGPTVKSLTTTNVRKVHYIDDGDAAGSISLGDLLTCIDRIGQHGYSADTLLISPGHYNSLLQLADFTAIFVAGDGATTTTSAVKGAGLENTFVQDTNKTRMIGNIYGLNVISNAWVPVDKICIMDSSVKPVAYVERRGLTVEEANPGFGIVGSYLSLRYGLKIVNALAGVIIENKS